MKNFEAQKATPPEHWLAEGPIWDGANHTLLWVDIQAGSVHSGKIRESEILVGETMQFDGTVGAVATVADGTLLVATSKNLVHVGEDGAIKVGPQIVADAINSRTNDGKVDPQGRYLIGTLALDDRVGQEYLYRLELDGSLSVIDSDVILSNGLGWSPDGSTFYNVDSGKHIIWKRQYLGDTSAPGPREVFLEILDGYPDGLTIDQNGNIWVAVWGCGEVRCFSPVGELLATVATKAPHTSSCTFAGDKLDRLVITTARVELHEDELIASPNSGTVMIANVEACGMPATHWKVSF
jgi:sugar lactone lactonase YvrE